MKYIILLFFIISCGPDGDKFVGKDLQTGTETLIISHTPGIYHIGDTVWVYTPDHTIQNSTHNDHFDVPYNRKFVIVDTLNVSPVPLNH